MKNSQRLDRILAGGLSVISLTFFLGIPTTSIAQTVMPPCAIQPQANRTIVSFQGESLRSNHAEDDGSPTDATEGPIAVSLPAGQYSVTLMSYDDHASKPGQLQPREQYFLLLSNGQQTGAISDLPDNDPNNNPNNFSDTLVEVVNSSLIITDPIVSVKARHAAYPDTTGPNSIRAVCAAFDLLEPLPTPTPTPTSTPDGSGSGPGDIGPDPTVAPTPTAKPKGSVRGIKATPTPTPVVAAARVAPATGPLPLTPLSIALSSGVVTYLLRRLKKT